jgi:23S rRNA pseudouridine1911/1915/1917 synthase
MELRYSIKVPPGTRIQPADIYLSSKISKLTLQKAQALIHKKCVMLNGEPVIAGQEISSGGLLEIYLPYRFSSDEIVPENIPLEILYEDEFLMVINKPRGMAVHRGLGVYAGTLQNALAGYFTGKGIETEIKQGLVHRLDKGTSGLIVFAKDRGCREQLQHQFAGKEMLRQYIALVNGVILPDKGRIDISVGRDPINPMVIRAFEDGSGKHAVTDFTVRKRLQDATLVECVLQTGRTHQIRIHLQHIGHAILGDKRYPPLVKSNLIAQAEQELNMQEQMLHAKSVSFFHPVTKSRMNFTSLIPPDMIRAICKINNLCGAL